MELSLSHSFSQLIFIGCPYGPDPDQSCGDTAVNKTVIQPFWNLHSTKRGLENKYIRHMCILDGGRICEDKNRVKEYKGTNRYLFKLDG